MDEELPVIVLRGLEGNLAPTLSPLQLALLPHAELIRVGYWIVWGLTLAFVVATRVWPAYRASRSPVPSRAPTEEV